MGKSNSSTPEENRPRLARWLGPVAGVWRAWSAAAIWFALTVLILTPIPTRFETTEGESILEDVYAPTAFKVPNADANRERRRVDMELYGRFWAFDKTIRAEAARRLEDAFGLLTSRRPASGSDIKQISDEISESTMIVLGNADLDLLYKGNLRLDRFGANLRSIADRALSGQFIVDDSSLLRAHREMGVLVYSEPPDRSAGTRNFLSWPAETRRYLLEELREYYPGGERQGLREVGAKLLMDAMGPNLKFDEEFTERQKANRLRRHEADPIEYQYDDGELIARAGSVVTPSLSLALKKVNEIQRRAYPFKLAGVVALTFFSLWVVILYLGRLRNDLRFTASTFTMVCLPLVLALGVGRLLVLLPMSDGLVMVLFPSAMVGILAAIMIGPAAGFILVLVSSLTFGVATGQELDFHLYALFGGFTAVISLRSLRERKAVLVTGLRVAMVNFATVLLLALFHVPFEADWVLLLFAFLNGVVYAAVALPLFAIFETAFGVVTDIRLLEITSPDNSLIREMEEKAPGSYQHVLNVVKLAESAADAIDANYLLVRAGAYFHDIGKMLKPKYFSENQITLEDKKSHSRLSPYMSTLIIKNHVKEGIELGNKGGLPQKIIDFIPQHHGTSLISYFFNEALKRYEESESTDPVREEEFRYPGPKPQTIETAVVMLADSVEAIVTSTFTSSQVDENDLRRVVSQAISDRFQDGQFDECDLTMRDLSLIRESFIKTLKARFHHRISYPGATSRREPMRESRDGGAVTAPAAQAGA